jgi:chemotaxis protein MotB
VRRRTRLNRRVVQSTHDRWLVSYADFITLMFAFFAVMYASSTVDARKLASMIESMQQVFAGQGTSTARGSVPDLRTLQQLLQEEFSADLQSGRIVLERDGRGLVVSIMESGSFGTGSAELPPDGQALLARIGSRLAAMPNAIRVEGHTDDVPIQTARFGSNWELSTARATRVVQALSREGGVDPTRLSAAGYAEFHPRVPNDSPGNRARNRRVDLVILNDATRRAEEPDAR